MSWQIYRGGEKIGTVKGTELKTEDEALQNDWDELLDSGISVIGGGTSEDEDFLIDEETEINKIEEENVNLFMFELQNLGYETVFRKEE